MIALKENPHLGYLVRNRLEMHYKADEIIKGVYWENGKGCAVGCMTESDNPYSSSLWDDAGIGLYLPRLCDTIFEGLPNGKAKKFPLRFWSAIESAKGKGLGLVHWKFLYWIFDDILSNFHAHPTVGKVVLDVRDGMALLSSGNSWDAAAYVANAADAADAARAAYAANAADAADAADAAAYAAAYAASAAVYERMADKLIELIREEK